MRGHSRRFVKTLKRQIGKNEVKAGAEIGVWRGGNAAALLSSFPELNLLMVDCYDENGNHETMPKSPRELRAAEQEATAATQFAHDRRSRLKQESVDAAKTIKDESLDFVFIDACHLYEAVRDDLAAWYPKVKDGGVIGGHDYNGKMEKKGVWGVKKAVDEFAKAHGLEVVEQGSLVWWVKKGEPKKEAPVEPSTGGHSD